MSHIIIVFFVLFSNLILQGNREDACYVYEQAIAIEKGKEDSQTLPFLFAQYSRFLHLVRGVCISFTSCKTIKKKDPFPLPHTAFRTSRPLG